MHREDRKVVNALLTFDYLSKISHQPPVRRKTNSPPSIQALIASLLHPCPPPTETACHGKFSVPTFDPTSSSSSISKSNTIANLASSSIIRTNSTTLPAAASSAMHTLQHPSSGDFRDHRARAGTASGRVTGLSNRRFRGYASLEDNMDSGQSGGIGKAFGGTHQGSGGSSGLLTSSGTISGGTKAPPNTQQSSSRSSSVSSTCQKSGRTPSMSATQLLRSKGWERPGPEGDEDRIQTTSFMPDICGLLQYCSQAEVKLSTFTQGEQ